MKNIVLAALAASAMSSAAMAADFGGVVSQPAPAAFEAMSDWTGFYAGVFGGVSTGDFNYNLTPTGAPSVLDADVNGGGLFGGVQIGADYQMNQFVIGAIADIAATNHRADVTLSSGGTSIDAESRLTYLGTVRARAGFAFDDALAYVHGGLAYGRTEASINAAGVAATGIEAANRTGYVLGAGLEYQVTDSISLQTEYSYTNFGDQGIYTVAGGSVNEALSFHSVKAGLNFRF